MKLDKFVSALLPSFSRKDVRTDISNIRDEIGELLPIYRTALLTFKNFHFQDKEVKAFASRFDKAVNNGFNGNFIVVTDLTLQRALDNLPVVEKLVERHFADEVFRDAMTYLRANVIQYVEALSFATRYATKLLNWVTWAESAAVDNFSRTSGNPLKPAEVEWLVTKAPDFFAVLNMLGLKKEVVEKQFGDIPDVAVTEESSARIDEVIGKNRTDPFKFGFIPTWMNPFYHISMKVAEYQAARYDALQEERQSIELRLLNLRNAIAGNDDPNLQEKIEYNLNRRAKVSARLSKMEEEYGL